MGKTKALAAWLDRAVDTPRAWGDHDCNLWPANWVVNCGHGDPAAPWRGRYDSAISAARLVKAEGGMEALWRDAARRATLPETSRPLAGDVGLISVLTPATDPLELFGLVGAICIGGREWAVVSEDGLFMARRPVIQAWRVEWRIP